MRTKSGTYRLSVGAMNHRLRHQRSSVVGGAKPSPHPLAVGQDNASMDPFRSTGGYFHYAFYTAETFIVAPWRASPSSLTTRTQSDLFAKAHLFFKSVAHYFVFATSR